MKHVCNRCQSQDTCSDALEAKERNMTVEDCGELEAWTQLAILAESPTGKSPEEILRYFSQWNTPDFKLDSILHNL